MQKSRAITFERHLHQLECTPPVRGLHHVRSSWILFVLQVVKNILYNRVVDILEGLSPVLYCQVRQLRDEGVASLGWIYRLRKVHLQADRICKRDRPVARHYNIQERSKESRSAQEDLILFCHHFSANS